MNSNSLYKQLLPAHVCFLLYHPHIAEFQYHEPGRRKTDKVFPGDSIDFPQLNAYAEAFASIAPRLIPNMPKPVLMPATGGAAKESNASKPIAPKKAAIFGAGAGFGIGVVLTLFTGIIANLRPSKRQ